MTGPARRLALSVLLAVLPAGVLPAVPAAADPVRDAQWHLTYLDLATAHQLTRGEGVTVALIDSGVDASHPDLQGNLLPGMDLVDPGNGDAWTPEDHGTLVAGVLGGQGHGPGGGDGVLGVAPGARLLPIRTTTGEDGPDAQPSSHLIAEGVAYAVAQGASVVSISLSTSHSEVDERAIAAARRSDVVVVAAAGNRPDAEAVTFPAALPSVVAVGGVDRDGGQADFSVTGPELALAAPGDEIVTTLPGAEYAIGSGTSFAAPMVAGAAALVRARFPDLTADEVIHRLTATATDAGPPGPDERYGHGILDIVAALTAEVAPMPPPADEPDEIRRNQWHLDLLDLPAAHELTRGEEVTVALVGSGVDGTHPDLHHNTLPGIDLAEPEHDNAWTAGASGTALAGIIAGHGNRLFDHAPGNRGVLGVAPAARLLPVRVTGAGTELTDEEQVALAADGIERATAAGASVICYAAGRASQDLFAGAVEAARAADVVLIAAAGDVSDAPAIWFPAANPAVVAVAGVDRDGELTTGSRTGPEVTLAAPAVDILTTAPDGAYTEDSRSGAAAAIVAGAAALVRARFPDLTADEVIHRLTATATDAGPSGRDDRYGHGVLNLAEALTAEVPPLVTAGPAAPPAGGDQAGPQEVDLGPWAAAVLAGTLVLTAVGTTLLFTYRNRNRNRNRGRRPPAT